MSDSTVASVTSNDTETSTSYSSAVETDYEAEIDDDIDGAVNVDVHEDLWDDELVPYQDEPLADEEWMENYRRRRQQRAEEDAQMQRRLRGYEPVQTWCQCGNCKVELVINAKECSCCAEIKGCGVALNDEKVVKEVGAVPGCITLHPGFRPICLEAWALRFSADMFKTKLNKRYRKKDDENAFLRAVAYRYFTRMVHGKLGRKRMAIPACAYDAIRKTFPTDVVVGYQEEDE